MIVVVANKIDWSIFNWTTWNLIPIYINILIFLAISSAVEFIFFVLLIWVVRFLFVLLNKYILTQDTGRVHESANIGQHQCN